MIKELKDYFDIIESRGALERYSDKSGAGLGCISRDGVVNEKIGFEMVKDEMNSIPSEYINKFFEFLELFYIADKLGIAFNRGFLKSLFKEYQKFKAVEGEPYYSINKNVMDIFLKEDKLFFNDLVSVVKKKLLKIKSEKKKIFFQDRIEWTTDWIKEKMFSRRRLAINICDEGVFVL